VPKSCRVPKILELKTGAQVMMLKNLEVYIEGEDEPRKLFNGSRGQVAGFAEIKGLIDETRLGQANPCVCIDLSDCLHNCLQNPKKVASTDDLFRVLGKYFPWKCFYGHHRHP
jgi:hypothetical protein